MQLFYNPEINEISKEFFFEKEESRHIAKVLRMKEGETLHLTNGKGSFFEARLVSNNPNKSSGEIIAVKAQPPLPYQLHLAVAPTKMNDRYEWFLEKVVEIGVSEITPIICDRSERKTIKPERFEKIIQSAMKQSLKAYLPVLNPVVSFKNFIALRKDNEILKCIAHCEESERQSLKSIIKLNQNMLILIGPEGDFSSAEIELAKVSGFLPVHLGESRLRTETAAVVACQSVAFVNEP